MRRVLSEVALAFVIVFGVSSCNKAGPNTITVSAEMTLDVPADAVFVHASIFVDGESLEEVLKALVQEHKVLKSDLPKLPKVEALRVESSDIKIRRIPTQECLESLLGRLPDYTDAEDILDYYEMCPSVKYRAFLSMDIRVQPPQAVGGVIALTALSESVDMELGRFAVIDMQAARRDAKAAAASRIRDFASDVAGNSGVQLGEMTKLTFRGDTHFVDNIIDSSLEDGDEIVVTGSRIKYVTEEVTLDLEPKMIEIKERVVATFEISE